MKIIRKRIEHLREQPESARLRALAYTVLGTGSLLLVIWLVILLPFQIRVQGPADDGPGFLQALLPGETADQPEIATDANPAAPTRQPQVGGVRRSQPTSIPGLFKTATPTPASSLRTEGEAIPGNTQETASPHPSEARSDEQEPVTLPVEQISPTPTPTPNTPTN